MNNDQHYEYDDTADVHSEYLSSHEPRETLWADGRTPDPSRICTAKRTNGEPCRKVAIKGASVCATHGGRAPQVKAKAKARLENAADRMAKLLLNMAEADDVSDAVKLNAIRDALDRSGVSAKNAVEVTVGPMKPWESVMDGIAAGSRAESRARRGIPLDEADHALIGAPDEDADTPHCAGCGRSLGDAAAWLDEVPEFCRPCRESKALPPAFGDREPIAGSRGFAPDLPGGGVRGFSGVDGPAAASATSTANLGPQQSNGLMSMEDAIAAQAQAERRYNQGRRQ